MSRDSALEQRYRRLLAWYPVDHRRAHAEEMIGVLLASSPEGRRRPTIADAIDLVRGGLRTRLGRSLRDGRDAGWQDTFAVTSVAIPMMLVASWIGGNAIWVSEMIGPQIAGPVAFMPQLLLFIGLPLLFAVLIPVVAIRYRRTAALMAVCAAVLFIIRPEGILPTLLEAVALVMSAGPSRAVRLLRRADWTALCLAAVLLSVPNYVRAVLNVPLMAEVGASALGIVAGLAVLVTRPAPVGRRVAALAALAVYPSLTAIAGRPLVSEGGVADYLPMLALAGLITLLVWRSRQRDPVRRDSDADLGAGGPDATHA